MLLLSVTARAWNGENEWPVKDAADERIVLRALVKLDAYKAEHDAAFLLAADGKGSLGSWNLEGARELARELDSARSPGLQRVRQELREAVSRDEQDSP